MAKLEYIPPNALKGRNYFGGRPGLLNRLRTLLLLTGHGKVSNNGNIFDLKIDFMKFPNAPSGKFKVRDIAGKIPNCTTSQLRNLLRNAGTKNQSIHTNIFNETIHCIEKYEKKEFIASFVHLYRLIEHTALYLPLIAITSKGVNNLTLNQYQQIINNKAKSDLSILGTFSTDFLDASFGNSNARYSFGGTSKPQGNAHIAKSIIGNDNLTSSGLDYIEVKFSRTDRLIVEFRNQFFHYLYHEKNISLNELENPDEFLEVCMPNFLTYFSFVYRELLQAEWELWA